MPRTKISFALALLSLTLLLGSACTAVRAGAVGGLPSTTPRSTPSASSATGSQAASGTGAAAAKAAPRSPSDKAPVASKTAAEAQTVAETIHEAQALYDLGVSYYEKGETVQARASFDGAIEKLTSGPAGARGDARLADAYADLMRDIQDLETSSYQSGAGLSPATEPPPLDLLDEIVPEITPEQAAKDRKLVEQGAEPSDLPMVVNDRVLAWVETYRGTLHDRFQEGLTRSGRYIEMIRRVFREEGLPEDLAYLAHVESAYKPSAYSRARAKGIWQFIVGTGSRYGLRRDWWIDERSDPELSTRAAAAYLKDLYAMFGDWYLAMAGYNAGEGKIQRAMDRTGLHDFWSIANTSHIRLETKNYVPAILAAVLISKDPEKFGFTTEKEPAVVYDSVQVSSPTDLGVIAELAGSTIDDLKFLNPALARLMTPPNYVDFRLRVPLGTGNRFAAAFTELPVSARIPWKSHTVRRGETLAALSRRYGVSVSQIRQANGLEGRQGLQSGSQLQIPTYIAPPAGGHGDLLRSESVSKKSSKWVHKVRKGDTLASIAARYKTTLSALRSWNNLGSSSLKPGQRLVVYGGAAKPQAVKTSSAQRPPSTSRASAAGGGDAPSYRVRRGDTLFKIASRLSTTVENLCKMNNLSTRDPLLPGTLLKIER